MPNLPVSFPSGYTDDIVLRHGAAAVGATNFIIEEMCSKIGGGIPSCKKRVKREKCVKRWKIA